MFTKAPCKKDGMGILCLTYQYNCWARSRIKPQPVHVHCKNLILCYTFILAADPGTTTTAGYSHGAGITCSTVSGSQPVSEMLHSLLHPLFREAHTVLDITVMFGLSVPVQAVCSDRAGGSAALTCPSSCSTVSLLGENYRFFSFPIHFLATHAGCWSHGESVPNTALLTVRFGWWNCGFHRFLHPPVSYFGCIYLSRPGSVIRGSRSQDASPTYGSWQKVWAQHSWIPQLSHTLWKLQYIHHTNRSQCQPWWPPTTPGHGTGKDSSPILSSSKKNFPYLKSLALPFLHWHFHFSLPINNKTLVVSSPLQFSFGWVGFKAGLDSWMFSQSWFFGWLLLFLRSFQTTLRWSPSQIIPDSLTGSHCIIYSQYYY